MKKQVKGIVSAGLACLVAGSMVGCASSSSGSESTSAANGEKVTITVWTKNRHDLEYMTEVVEQFNATNDHIYIDYVVQSGKLRKPGADGSFFG